MIPTHQGVSNQLTASARVAEQEAVAQWQTYRHGLKRSLRETRDLGQALVYVQESRDVSVFGAWLKEKGIPQTTAYESIRIARNWSAGAKVDGCVSIREALKEIKESLLAIDAEGAGPGAEPTPPLKIADTEPVANTPSTDLRDAEGCVLPESVRPAIEEAKKIDEWITKAKLLAKEYKGLTETVAGVHLPETVIDGIRYYAVMVKKYKPDPIYRCNLCHGAGCDRCKKSGWLPKLLHDQATQVAEAA